MRLVASFRLLGADWPQRSSHMLGVLAPSHGLVFGGELEPRRPVAPASYAYPLLPGMPRRGKNELPSTGDVPAGRVGAGEEAGWYKVQYREARAVWEYIKDSKGDAPVGRSYCTGTVLGDTIYVHAGCLLSGRLSDLYAYDIPSQTWSRLADAPGEPRGGTALIAAKAVIDVSEKDVLLRWGGFAGHELGEDNALDVYTPSSNTWRTFHPQGPEGKPGPRSVHGFAPLAITSPPGDTERAVALMWMGERDPATNGHAGVSLFWDDAWTLLQVPVSDPSDASGGFIWRPLAINRSSIPEARGWFPVVDVPTGPSERATLARILMHGGLLSSNQRSGEAWLLEVRRDT
ncbi:hypothetical protein AURDEDRAFT_117887 [Auricularia subglabra TFB-10046 SS5]|uniref:Galactose oxidase n=1 Tax=Auricularia subglabra (strain TFB-10046 / SS5) TaxID=717982 RepID=J0D3X8_AURST|nr:hypothetical protein AURDEDRAFT_117887 [Auricularia subglabra TFB-10046 SS5]